MAYNTDRANAHRTGKKWNNCVHTVYEHLNILWAIYNGCETYHTSLNFLINHIMCLYFLYWKNQGNTYSVVFSIYSLTVLT